MNSTKHWEKIYDKQFFDTSWYQKIPTHSLDIIKNNNISFDAKIIDVGAGESFFVDNLLELGYKNITILDISQKAIDKVKSRLGSKANGKVKFIVNNILDFKSNEKYDFWHDRSLFHFITNNDDISKYISILKNNTKHNSKITIATFSNKAPDKCSDLFIKKYTETTISNEFNDFKLVDYFFNNHNTPSGNIQEFLFCTFCRK